MHIHEYKLPVQRPTNTVEIDISSNNALRYDVKFNCTVKFQIRKKFNSKG